ncbi:unnamed protein product [marine sediment metagenome]|uniref:Uncharacterized protein n=1 Tax=marine sediment metagenome TaxID=412755 RepID=X0VQD2_9ZZZZ
MMRPERSKQNNGIKLKPKGNSDGETMSGLILTNMDILRMIDAGRDTDNDNWTDVSDVLFPVVEDLPPLVECELTDKGGRARLTSEGYRHMRGK